MNIQWMASGNENQIVLSDSLFERLSQPKVLTIHFGSYEKRLPVLKGENLKNETIGLPMNLSDIYTIPTELPYECFIKDGIIYIGPIIAYIVKGKLENYNEKSLSLYLPRFKAYKDTNGLIFICTKEAINIEESLIGGYYYTPNSTKKGGKWSYGEFPLPDAIFNRSFIQKSKISMLQEKLGDIIFNSSFQNLDKWRIWGNLSKKKNLKQHLPYTEKYIDADQIMKFLNKYGEVYIKARRKSRGRGIFHICMTDNVFLVRDQKKQQTLLKNMEQLTTFLEQKIVHSSIVQQPVPFKFGNQVLDFRAYVQKNEKREWTFQGFTTRISQKGSVVTNTIGREDLLPGEEALSSIYQLDKETVLRIKNEMFEIVKAAVQVYEERGMHIADLAADIVVDDSLHLWLLELQLNYASEKKVYEIPPEVFNKIMITPFKYAKAITLFKDS